MTPCRTAVVGLLVISCALVQADVSHLYNVGDMANNLPQGTPFWWMSDKSPFKRAILGCNGGNGCAAQSNQVILAAQPSGFVSQQQQLGGGYELNPFLNAGSKHGSINMYLPPIREPESFPCEGPAVCVTRQACASGFILSTNVPQSGLNRPCLVNNEVCCRVQVPAPVVTTPAPVPSIPCNQPNFFCVPPQLCSNGLIRDQNVRLQSNPRCFGSDVCCRYQPVVVVPQPSQTTPRYIPPPTTPRYVPAPTTQRPVTTTQFRGPDYIPPRTGDASNPQPDVIRRGEEDKPLQITQQACPAAMNCTEIQFCDATGVISKTPVVLTRQQEQFRVPMTDCRDVRRNIVGKCCRDPDYVDPWPATILGQYNREIIGALFDDGSYKPPQGGFQQQTAQKSQVTTVQRQNTQSRFPDLVGSASGTCGVRNVNSVPRGAGEFDTGFGEFTWQAMVLMQSNKSLLCGGAIIDENTIATSAHCVQGVNPRDLKVKCGEWKLGVDDEPKPFQITGVRAVSFHPAYNPANLNNDLALLHCDERIRYDQHVGPICLEDQYSSASTDSCETTGWGKNVLRIHLKGAIMNRVPVQELSQNECSSALSGYGYNPQSSTCCRPQGADACLADVGSALACKMPSGQYLLRGIYSTETECASPSQIVSFAKIDTQWVRQAIRNPGSGSGFGQGSAQASQTITQTVVTNRHEVLAQPNNPHVYSVPSQAPLYLPPL